MKPPATPKVKRAPVLGDDQRILSLMFENILTKIEGIDLRVMASHDSTKDGLRDIGERLTRVETMQTNLEASVKTMGDRIQRVESESVRTGELAAVQARVSGLESRFDSHSTTLALVPNIREDLAILTTSVKPANTFFDRARWLLVGLSGIIGSIITNYVMHLFSGPPSF